MTDLVIPPANGAAAPALTDLPTILDLLLEPGQVAELRVLHAGPRRQTVSGYFDDPAKLAQFAAKWSGQAEGVYWTLNPCQPALLARCVNKAREVGRDEPTTTDKDIARRRWLLVDCDAERPKGISTTADEWKAAHRLARLIRKTLIGEGWPAPLYADSGNGAHLLWRIDLPNDAAALALVKGILEALAFRWDGAVPGVKVDTSNSNAARICKLYGTLAKKGEDTPERPHRLARVLEVPATLDPVTPAQLAALAATRPQDPTPERTTWRGAPGAPIDVPGFLQEHHLHVARENRLPDGTCYVLQTCPWDPSHTDRSAYVISFNSGAASAGCHHDSCQGKGWTELRALYDPPRRPAANGHKPAPLATNGHAPAPAILEAAVSQPALPNPDAPPDGRPVIRVTEEIHRVRDAILAALDAANQPTPALFQRGRTLVRVVEVPSGAHSYMLIEAHTPDSLRARVGEVARLVRFSPQTKTDIGADARATQLGAVLAADRFPFPVLDGIAEVPFLRPDGSLHSTPGYDPATRLVYHPAPGLVVPPVPDTPTPADLAGARALLLDELLGDFPFTSPTEQANALALLLLPFVRSLIDGPTPLHLIESPTPGSGKSLLAEMLLRPALGDTLVSDSDKTDEEETAKWITAKVAQGAPVLWIDNIKAGINNSTLANALTTMLWSGRVLGQTSTIQAPLRCVWVATANNPTLSTEIARRTIRIRIDPQMDRPQLREGFRHPDLRAWARAERGALVGAALTLIRAWVVAGQPAGTQQLGSYERWVAVLGGILQVAGVEGFLGNLLEVYDLADTEGTQWRALVAAWWEKYGSSPQPASAIYELAAGVEGFDLGRHPPDSGGAMKAFGKALARQRDRMYGPVRIVHAGTKQRIARWALVPQGDPESVCVYFGVFSGTPPEKTAPPPTTDSSLFIFSEGVEKHTPTYTNTHPTEAGERTDPCPTCGDVAWYWSAAATWECASCLQSEE